MIQLQTKRSKKFKKAYSRLNAKDRELFKKKYLEFLENPNNPTLRNHKLFGKHTGLCAFSVKHDLRCIYRIENNYIELTNIGTYSFVY